MEMYRISSSGVFCMLKSSKKAFSYIELIFGMVMVSIIFSLSIPIVVKKADSQPALSGTFMCFSAYDNDTETFRLYETMRRGNGNFSELVDVTETGCNFYKQKNIRTYNVTLIGGGGASNKATDTAVSVGQAGQRISIPNTTLAGVWDKNNRLNIRMCKNGGLKDAVIPYESEFEHCVGTGGAAHRDETLGSTGQDEETYTNLLGAYHDVLYESRTNVDTIAYVGLGNGILDVDDVAILGSLTNGTAKTQIINGVNGYLNLPENNRTIAKREDLFKVAKTLRGQILNNGYSVVGNHGGMGGYSRFVLYDTNPLDCIDGFGNCVARGGLGGGYSANAVNIAPKPEEGAEKNTMLAEIRAIIANGTSDIGPLMSQLGVAGPQCGSEEVVVPGETIIVQDEVETIVPGAVVTVRNSTVSETTCNQYLNNLNASIRRRNKSMGVDRAGAAAAVNNWRAKYNNACCDCTKQVQIPDTVKITSKDREVKLPDTVAFQVTDSPVANGGAIVISW